MENYEDITNKWMVKSLTTSNNIRLYNIGDYFTYKGKRYKYDNHYIKYLFDEGEYSFAKWLSKRTNKVITLIPKIDYPQNVKTADFRIGNYYYDLKTIYGKDKQIIYHKIHNKKEQANRFIFDITNNSSLRLEELLDQVNKLFGSKNNDTIWVEMIGIRYKNKFIMLRKKVN